MVVISERHLRLTQQVLDKYVHVESCLENIVQSTAFKLLSVYKSPGVLVKIQTPQFCKSGWGLRIYMLQISAQMVLTRWVCEPHFQWKHFEWKEDSKFQNIKIK